VLPKMLMPRRFRDPDYAASIAGKLYAGTARNDGANIAEITGAPGANAALITAAGYAGRATVGGTARTMLRWELDDAASARFARLEIRDAQRRPLGAMVALTNPVRLA
jgi:hypothetical protein